MMDQWLLPVSRYRQYVRCRGSGEFSDPGPSCFFGLVQLAIVPKEITGIHFASGIQVMNRSVSFMRAGVFLQDIPRHRYGCIDRGKQANRQGLPAHDTVLAVDVFRCDQ